MAVVKLHPPGMGPVEVENAEPKREAALSAVVAGVRKPNAVCTVCGSAYWKQPNRLQKSRFCSRACRAAGRNGGLIQKDELSRLYYDDQRSMQEIAKHFGCSQNKIAYWMTQYGFERRTWSEATYIHRNPEGDPFKVKIPGTPEEWQLFGAGIGLYMGEGTKTGTSVALANTSPSIHRVFLTFLDRICGVSKRQVKAWINVYNDCDVDEAHIWWCDQLGLTLEQFYMPTVRESRGGNYTNKSKYGTLTISFSNSKLKKIIDNWCIDYCSQLSY
jgi:hypothetical protein